MQTRNAPDQQRVQSYSIIPMSNYNSSNHRFEANESAMYHTNVTNQTMMPVGDDDEIDEVPEIDHHDITYSAPCL
jgi:hypothetical protein